MDFYVIIITYDTYLVAYTDPMKRGVIGLRNHLLHFLYKSVLKPIFFRFDPEVVHDRMVNFGSRLGRWSLGRFFTRLAFGYRDPALEQTICGTTFPNPIGLAAGFDKNAQLTDIIPSVGFGFHEVGSITGEPCEGNPRPRLQRLPRSKSLRIYYGLKNDGCQVLATKLLQKRFALPLGINIAKTNSPETCDIEVGVADYIKSYKAFAEIGDYYTINISCPNTYGGQPFTDPSLLRRLLDEIELQQKTKPIFIKLSPDLSKQELDAILKTVEKYRIDGFIISNLTKNRENHRLIETDIPDIGGLSGRVVQNLSDEMISYVYQKTAGKYVIIGLGGIFSAEDAYHKIKLGASLVQLITGMIYEGPQVISEINRGLVTLLHQEGYSSISDVVGSAHR